jgi:hypothetical protein
LWSASSGLAVAEWRLARERGTDQRRIEMGRSIQLVAGALGNRPLLRAMCRVTQQQVWLAVAHQLMPLELSLDSVVQKPVVCAIDADHCITDLAQAESAVLRRYRLEESGSITASSGDSSEPSLL